MLPTKGKPTLDKIIRTTNDNNIKTILELAGIPHKIQENTIIITGEDSKTVNLRALKNKDDWKDWSLIDKEERWTDGLLYELFPNTKEFISTLPFKSIGRVFISFTHSLNSIHHQGNIFSIRFCKYTANDLYVVIFIITIT